MEAILFKITLWSFFAGMLAHFCALFPKQGSRAGRVFHSMALILVGLGFLSLSTAIIQRWASQGRVPISSSYEYLSLTAWFVAVLYFFVLYKVRKWAMFLGACISSGLFLNMIFAGMYPRKLEMTLIPALQSYWLKIHVSLTIVSEAVFALAFILGVLYLLKNYRPGRVSSRTRHLSLLLAIATELVGMSFLASLTLAGLVLQGVTGPMLVVCMLGGGFLVALPLYLAAYRRWVSPLDQNGHGGAVFALAVLSLLLAGMMIGAWIGRNSQRIESTGHRILILNQLISRAGQEGDLLTAERLESIRRGKQEELELFLSLEKLHAQVKHTLARKDAAELIARSSIEKNLDFPLTLGEIRGERRRLQNDIAVLAGIIGELKLPVKATYLAGWRAELITGYNRMAATGLLPHDRGRTSAFLGFMLLLAAPFFLASYLAAGSIRDRIPELETLDSLSYRTVSLGFPIYTLGALICGAIWAHYAWGKWWSNDPKEIGSLIVWFVYAIYLHARYVRAWSGTHAAMAAVLGFLLAVLGFVGNSVLGGLHSYG